jgi:hypothetical protein
MTHAPCHACGRPAGDIVRRADNTWVAVCDRHDPRDDAARLRDDIATLIDERTTRHCCQSDRTWDDCLDAADAVIAITRAHIARGWGR